MAARRRRGDHEEEHVNHERWLLTYADMITLLMVLFIVLFAISQIDQKKFAQLHEGLAKSFGDAKVLDGGQGILSASTVQSITPDDSLSPRQSLDRQHQAARAAAQELEDMTRVRRGIAAALAAHGLTGAVQFSQETRGLVINVVTDRVLFELGSATLRPEGGLVLDAIAPQLVRLPNRLTVEGHTDNVPISGARYPSNWELSAERATTVLRYLLDRHVKPSLVSAAGYADQRPLLPNDSAAHRARNRRVAIVVLSNLVTSPAPPTLPVVPDLSTVPTVPGA